jgi:tetratricopeptide (TPR) repeat protein
MGEHDSALRDLDRILQLDPRSFNALGNRAYILEQLGRYDDAVKDLGAIVAIYPDNSMALKHLGHISRQKGDFDKSIRWYRMALKTEESQAVKSRIQEEIQELERKMGASR